jgi:hypothetical protein
MDIVESRAGAPSLASVSGVLFFQEVNFQANPASALSII